MDNQQERLHFYIGYLLGMLDGEGSYFIHTKYSYGGRKYYMPRIFISNSDKQILKMTVQAMKELGLPFYFWEAKNTKKGRKPVHQIRVIGIKRCKKMTDFLKRFPSGKRDRLQVLNDFCTYRLSIPQRKLQSGHEVTYSDIEEKFHQKIKEFNARGLKSTESSETIRSDATA